jgi:AcrR family transcriptional regulator
MKVNNPDIKSLVLRRAAELIANRTVKGLTMAELARLTGLAKTTLFKIVGSKEKLLEMVVLSQMETSIGLLATAIQEEGEYRPAARRIVKDHPAFLADSFRIPFTEVFLEYPALETTVGEARKKSTAVILDFIRRGQNEGHIRDDVSAEFLFDLSRAIVDHYTAAGLHGDTLKKALTDAFRCLREGIRKGDW